MPKDLEVVTVVAGAALDHDLVTHIRRQVEHGLRDVQGLDPRNVESVLTAIRRARLFPVLLAEPSAGAGGRVDSGRFRPAPPASGSRAADRVIDRDCPG
jgi:hypothetical protein